jgi:hypothetical protein
MCRDAHWQRWEAARIILMERVVEGNKIAAFRRLHQRDGNWEAA